MQPIVPKIKEENPGDKYQCQKKVQREEMDSA